MNVAGIFKTLIIIVACVAIGALVLNILLPNVAVALVDATEDMIFKATKMSFNFNGNTHVGGTNVNNTQGSQVTDQQAGTTTGTGVEGFQ